MMAMHRIEASMLLPAAHSAMPSTFIRLLLFTSPTANVLIMLLTPMMRPASSVVVRCCRFLKINSASVPDVSVFTITVNIVMLKRPDDALANSEITIAITIFR